MRFNIEIFNYLIPIPSGSVQSQQSMRNLSSNATPCLGNTPQLPGVGGLLILTNIEVDAFTSNPFIATRFTVYSNNWDDSGQFLLNKVILCLKKSDDIAISCFVVPIIKRLVFNNYFIY